MTKRVAILGCGPAGLLAAHAANISGWDFCVYSAKVKSNLYGAQYLHHPIPELNCGVPKVIHYKMEGGTPMDYRQKVYGESWDGNTSPEDLMEVHSAWDIRRAYDDLWDLYRDRIWDADFTAYDKDYDQVTEVIRDYGLDKFDLVISSVPRTIWAQPGDVFESQRIWALGDADEQRVFLNRPDPFTVVCNADPDVPWYRISNIYGFCTMEWPSDDWNRNVYGSPARGASVVTKPLRHNSTAASEFVHVGRYGKWEKGVLTTDAFFDSMLELARFV